MYGPEIDDRPDDHPKWMQWREAVKAYRETGSWPHGYWMSYMAPFPEGCELPTFVWALRGAEVWVWQHGRWSVADPQPERQGGLLVGTLCFNRKHCALEMATDVHIVCADCGETHFSVPNDFSWGEWADAERSYQARVVQQESDE
jgi:hypothetical protein